MGTVFPVNMYLLAAIDIELYGLSKGVSLFQPLAIEKLYFTDRTYLPVF